MAGAGGMLGEAFYQVFSSEHTLKSSDIDVNANWLEYLDFRDKDKYRDNVMSFDPDWLFHLGAYTNLEYCEENIEDTYETNTEAVKTAVSVSNELNIPLLYISTAGIFDGKKDLYDESDKPNPLGHYANSKYEGEKWVIEHCNSYLICRAGWMMGGGPKKDKKFINKIMNQIREGKKTLSVVNDKLGTPTLTYDFAKNVELLIDHKIRGLYNMVCGGETSRLEVVKELVSYLGLQQEIIIQEVGSSFFSKEYFAQRPYCERLVNKGLDDLNLNIMRNWKVALHDYIDLYYNDLKSGSV